MGDKEAGILAYDKAVELDPKFACAYYGKGKVFSSLEMFEAAINAYDKVIELNCQYDEARYARENAILALEKKEATRLYIK